MVLSRRLFLGTLSSLTAFTTACSDEEETQIIQITGGSYTPPAPTEKHDFKMAYVIIGDSNGVTGDELLFVENIMTPFPQTWSNATLGMSSIAVDGVYFVNDNGDWKNNGSIKEAVRLFGLMNNGAYDFISFFPVVKSDARVEANLHFLFQNNVQGIGQSIFDKTAYYNAPSHMLGANLFGYLWSYRDWGFYPNIYEQSQNGGLHETGHQWGMFAGVDFTGAAGLEIKAQGIHFYQGVVSGTGSATPMNANDFTKNPDGTYTLVNHGISIYKRFHDAQLYFMGLGKRDNLDFSKRHDIVDMRSQPYLKHSDFSIDDIIAFEGERVYLG
ncbi:hypothetical protein KY328_03980 [Candidatus Woesearchaeota archaeon]|nr:hypothetical protein [Candidatus Woesearchaeota archaeon]MBW3022056.1 hypothetical protein [Candidatus Woesearchaeota archaeon]